MIRSISITFVLSQTDFVKALNVNPDEELCVFDMRSAPANPPTIPTIIETVETDDHSVGSGPSESEMKEVKSFIQLARKFFKQKKREKAVDLLKQAHKIDPKNAEVLVLLGTVKVEMDDFLDADKYFSKALQGISC